MVGVDSEEKPGLKRHRPWLPADKPVTARRQPNATPAPQGEILPTKLLANDVQPNLQSNTPGMPS